MSPARPGDGLLHPAVLSAIAVLVLNDHVLKAAFHNPLTGKLSDFAGLLFFPLFLQAALELIGRRPPSRRLLAACAAATALVFAAVQVWPPATDLYRWGLGALQYPVRGALVPVAVTPDPTDLIALPTVLIAVAISWHRQPRAMAPRA